MLLAWSLLTKSLVEALVEIKPNDTTKGIHKAILDHLLTLSIITIGSQQKIVL